jgi:hypothetical protein
MCTADGGVTAQEEYPTGEQLEDELVKRVPGTEH